MKGVLYYLGYLFAFGLIYLSLGLDWVIVVGFTFISYLITSYLGNA